MARHVLVLGGARSGKTTFSEHMALRIGTSPLYLATSEVLDEEMAGRVEAHRRSRDQRFTTLEEPLALSETILASADRHDVILVDCLTLWMNNLLAAGSDVAVAVNGLAVALMETNATRVILVSNEVGLGIVPDNPMARMFRDLAGTAHQRLAEVCEEVHFIVAGLPLTLKGHTAKLD